MTWAQRWRWWRERRRIHPPNDAHRAGELAEQRLARLCRAAGKANGWRVFESLRIPDPEQGGKREIDLVILGGDVLLVVEQKHWSGRFSITLEDTLLQYRNNGTEHDHGGVAQRIERKARMLASMMPDVDLTVEVVLAFTHPSLTWPDDVDRLEPTVVDERGMIQRLEGERPGPINDRALAVLESLGTWDEVMMNGGLSKKGDVLDMGLGEDVNRWLARSPAPVEITVHHRRGILSMMSATPTKAQLKRGGEGMDLTLPSSATVRMHVVGQASPETVRWSQINGMNLSGHRHG